MSVTAVPLQPTRKRILVMLWLGILAAIVGAAALAATGTGRVVAAAGTNEEFLAYNARQSGVETTASGLQYKVLAKGEGDQHPTDQDVALINYVGKLRDGTVFQESDRPMPLPVKGGIKGFTEGLKLMTKGAKYRLWIKPDLAYGANSPDPNVIPPNALLVFDVELVDFIPQQVLQQMQMQQMMQGGGAGAPPPGAQ